jgi:putative transposase
VREPGAHDAGGCFGHGRDGQDLERQGAAPWSIVLRRPVVAHPIATPCLAACSLFEFATSTNHVISTKLDRKAAVSRKAIALEDLSGIRERTTVRHERRYERHAWAFFQLRQYIAYKAAQADVPVHLVDPRNTSRTCSACGHCEKANRQSQAEFLCQRCGFAANADYNAALNISRKQWAAVNRPMASALAG